MMNSFRIAVPSLTYPWRRDHEPDLAVFDNYDPETAVSGQLARAVFPSLAVFRFLAFTMGVGLEIIRGSEPTVGLGLLLGAVAVFNIVRVLARRFPTDETSVFTVGLLAIDLILSLALVVFTDGLDSPFLIYSLGPILVASLLMNLPSAMFAAIASSVAVIAGHVAPLFNLGGFPWILDGNYLAVSLLYSAVCLLCSQLPFLANLNWRRRLNTAAVSSERNRLRREIHDNVAQTLAFLSLKVKRAEERAEDDGAIRVTPRDMRDIASSVERVYLTIRDYLDGVEDHGRNEQLKESFDSAVKEWGRDTGLTANVSVHGSGPEPSPYVKGQMLQITKEALANVAKHAFATRVNADLDYDEAGLKIKIRDDGRGFLLSGPSGHGMDIMRERATLAGVSLDVQSEPGDGTSVTVEYKNSKGR
jgi:signal transduction histidine kinase